jgi:hypothetical protein
LTARGERWLLVITPFVAMTTVGVGLRVGAADPIVAATVYSAAESRAGLGLAWQLVAFRVTRGAREPLASVPLEVTTRVGAVSARWTGATNEDGVAEMQLPVSGAAIFEIEVRSGSEILAKGQARVPPRLERSAVTPVWMPFARREGAIVLDVAVLGQRLAPGFPASLWVRAIDASSGARLSGVTLQPDADGSLTFGQFNSTTSKDGWGELTATSLGFAISLGLRARIADGRTGAWRGGLFASPGAVKIETRERWAPGETAAIRLVAPTVRPGEYFEIDDGNGRVWAAAVSLVQASDGTSSATVVTPALPPGLYWAVASTDPGGATMLGPGTATLPFFVAANDQTAARFGTDPAECAAPADADGPSRALGPCLAVAAALPVARWTALDGFSEKNGKLRDKRRRGMAIAGSGALVAMALEALLVFRAAARGRRLRQVRNVAEPGERPQAELTLSPPLLSTIALLIALLGFALVAAFVLRWA